MFSNKGVWYLVLAILFEVTATSFIYLSDGFTNVNYIFGVAAGVFASIYFLGRSLEQLPLSIAYAVWVGLGTVLVTFVDLIVFDSQFSLYTVGGILLIIGGVAALNHYMRDTESPNNEREHC